jgi:signal transduction histidine kinase
MLSASKLFETAQNQLDHNRLFALINSINDGIISIDDQGIIKLSNGVALGLLDTNSLDGKPIGQVLKLTDKAGRQIDSFDLIKKSGNGLTSRDYSLKNGPQSEIHIYMSIAPVRAAYGKTSPDGHVIILRDITLEKTRDDERDEFISVASHELRSPVTIAEGGISNALLLAERSHLPDTILQSLKSAHQQMVFLMALINDLALLSRADAGHNALLVEEVDITKLVAELNSDYQPQAAKKGIGLEITVSHLPPKVFTSRLYVKEILQNLITNAIKYTEKGMVKVNVSADSNTTSFQVQDTGIGIDKLDLAKLFTKFFRSEDYRVRQNSGTGLGLYISAKLANLISGRILAASELNRGSSFTLIIPNSIYHSPPGVA